MRVTAIALAVAATLFAAGCTPLRTEHRVGTIDNEPIKIDITVRLKVDRELDNFFDDLDKQDPTQADQ